MASDRAGASRFALGLGLRAALVGALVFGLAALLLTTQFYATALLLAGVIALVVADMTRAIARADQTLEQFADSLAMDGMERPILPQHGFFRSAQAIDKALDRMTRNRSQRERRLDHAESLLDTVGAALLVLGPGRVELANRAARRMAGRDVRTLAEIEALGPDALAQVAGLTPGARVMLRLADGRPMLALAAGFTAPDGDTRLLVSLQPVTGELDTVEQKAWRDLAHILAHEMMNSLTPIVSLSETAPALLARGAVDEAAEAAEVVARRARGLMAFVDGYRRFADLPPPQPMDFAAADLVDDIDRLMRPTLLARGVGYVATVEPGLMMRADRGLMEQAMINLIKNAADAVEGRGDPQVRLDCREEDGTTVIAVADNGPGVAAEDRERIFVPFFTTRARGSGVGLSLVRQIAVVHSGQVNVLSNPPVGSVFRLALPAVQSVKTGV